MNIKQSIIAKSFNLVRYMSLSWMNFAITRIVPNFANSAGCSPNFPKSNHAFAPPTSFPKNKKTFIPALFFFILGLAVISGVNYGYDNILEPHQKERIDIILGKEINSLGSGYNLNQSLIAIGSGGFSGKGYLNGTQTKFNFVPEQNTDFIFCTISEEFGFLGSISIII